MTVSRNWLPGYMTLLHSVERVNGPHDHCGYLFIGSPMVPDSQLSAPEKKIIRHIVGSKPTIFHNVDSDRLSYLMRVPNLRPGVLLAWMKLDLFHSWANECGMPKQIIFLDTDTLVINSLTFIQRYLKQQQQDAQQSNRTSDKWALHGSANWYGLSGWVFATDMTPAKPRFINTGFLAFRRPAPEEFLNALHRRIEQRIRDNLKIYMADQDVINHAFDNSNLRHSERKLHQNWYANYRPNSEQSLRGWRVAHWMGVEKPWGKKGHTRGPVRYNDGVLPRLDSMWLDECHQVATKALLVANLTIECGDGVERAVHRVIYGARMSVSAAVALWVFAAYLTADWDHAGWFREPLGLRGDR